MRISPFLLSILLLLSACGGSGGGGAATSERSTTTLADAAQLRPAQSNSPYASVLVDCVLASGNASLQLCKFSSLPLIGLLTNLPTKNDVLAQTVVSEPWMATRFAQLLDYMPQDIYRLFRGVTAVVIGNNISPSYYSPYTGAIYLDANYLTRVSDEKLHIFSTASFDPQLKFRVLQSLINGNYRTPSSNPDMGSIKLLAGILFHELGHANDYMPPAQISSINRNNNVIEQVDTHEANGVYRNDLSAVAPLKSAMLTGLADVLHNGRSPTISERMLTAQQVGDEFSPDGANDTYSYFTAYEDTSMLFEEVMMKYHFNEDRAIAFTDVPVGDSTVCENYIVRWGEVNRIAAPQVKARAQIVLKKFLGVSDVSAYFNNLTTVKNMNNGTNFCRNLDDLYPE